MSTAEDKDVMKEIKEEGDEVELGCQQKRLDLCIFSNSPTVRIVPVPVPVFFN
jgi:hypothetical protein